MTRRRAVVFALLVVATGVGLRLIGSAAPAQLPAESGAPVPPVQFPRVANRPAGGDPALVDALPVVQRAHTTRPSTVHGVPAGPALTDGQGFDIILEPNMDLAVLEGPRVVSGKRWYRVYVLSNPNVGPAEYFGWVRMDEVDGGEAIAFREALGCPDDLALPLLGALDPFTRAACLGHESVELRGWTWDRMLPSWYEVTPAWFGEQNGPVDSTISLHADPRHPGVPGPGPFPYLELQLPPGLEPPPLEFQVQTVVHAADALSGGCVQGTGEVRLGPEAEPGAGPLWCTTRLVVEQWMPLLGPEQRAIDPSAPQLHRHPERAGNNICGGVGMGPLVFRMDPTRLDPIWLESAERGAANGAGWQVIPNFDPGFRAVFTPALAIIDERGVVVAQDGTPVDPDGALAGHAICPTGRVVFFD